MVCCFVSECKFIRVLSWFNYFPHHVKLCDVCRSQSPLFIVAGNPERPPGNNPQSLYSRLRVLQVGQLQPKVNWVKTDENKPHTFMMSNPPKTSPHYFSDLFDISSDNGEPLMGLWAKKKSWTLGVGARSSYLTHSIWIGYIVNCCFAFLTFPNFVPGDFSVKSGAFKTEYL